MVHRDVLVTVVMPAYNAELWIGKAIDSVISQSLPDWELIVVNDGSTDGTEAVVRKYSDPRLKIVRQENKGCYQARNVGIRLAKGKYIALLDADDWYEPQQLKKTTNFLNSYQECSLVGTNFFFVNFKGEKALRCKPREILGRPGDGVIPDYYKAAMRKRIFPVTCGTVFRKKLVRKLGAFDESLRVSGDFEFLMRWAMRSRFGYIDEPLCYYRVDTPGSVRKDLGRSVRMRLKVWQKLTAMEPTHLPCWESYAKCRSFCLFRLTAVAIAAGYFEEAKAVSVLWPKSPRHIYWWLGKSLASLPKFVHKSMHAILWNFDFVRYRQGKPAPVTFQENE